MFELLKAGNDLKVLVILISVMYKYNKYSSKKIPKQHSLSTSLKKKEKKKTEVLTKRKEK